MVFTSEGLPHLAEVRVSQTLEVVEVRPFSRTLERVIISEWGRPFLDANEPQHIAREAGARDAGRDRQDRSQRGDAADSLGDRHRDRRGRRFGRHRQPQLAAAAEAARDQRSLRRSFYPLARENRCFSMCRTALALRSTGRKRHASAHDAGAVLYNGLRVVEDRGGTPGSL
jgi:hypothetical protein